MNFNSSKFLIFFSVTLLSILNSPLYEIAVAIKKTTLLKFSIFLPLTHTLAPSLSGVNGE